MKVIFYKVQFCTCGHWPMYGISILSRTSTASRIIMRELLRLKKKCFLIKIITKGIIIPYS